MKKQILRVLSWLMIVAFCLTNIEPVYADETASNRVRVAIYKMEGFHSYNEYGKLEGYGIDYLNVMAGIAGWVYEYVEVENFTDACEKLAAGEVDLLGPAMMTEARKEKFAYSELPIGSEFTVLVTRSDRTDLYYEDYENFNGMKVAVLHDYPLTEYYISHMEKHQFQTELVYFNSIEESKAALAAGQVDAIVDSIVDMDDDAKMLARFSQQPFYFLVNKENTNFLKELNSVMSQVQNTYPTLLDTLLVEHYPNYNVQLYTRSELEYIEQAKSLKVGYVSGQRPLSFTDKEGSYEGVSKGIFEKIAEKSGLKFEYVELPKGNISYEYLKYAGIDLVTGVGYNTDNMNSTQILLSRPYLSTRKVMVSRPEFEYDANTSYKVGMVNGTKVTKDAINTRYPNLEIVDFETTEKSFQALYVGDIDMVVQNQYVVDSIMVKPVFSSFKIVPIDSLKDELCFAAIIGISVEKDMSKEESAVVIGIINKAISQISEEEQENIIWREMVENQYELDTFDFLYNYRFPLTAMLAGILVLTAFAIIYYRERGKRERILKEEANRNALQQKRYQTIVECSEDLIYEISLNGDSNIGSDRIRKKFGWEIPSQVDELDFAKAMEILHIHPEDEPIFRQTMLTNGVGKIDEQVLRVGKSNGEYLWCRVYRTLLMDENNNVVSILGKIVDVDEEVKEKRQLEYKSRTDLLTGLLNKQTFEKEVRDYVENNDTSNACFIFLDMDHFKAINDVFGHSVGDQVIKEIAKKIQLLFANFDLVGRFGGDEFCVFIKEIPRDTLIDRLKFAVKKLEQEYAHEEGAVKISASIGAAYCKRENISYKELMDMADAAAYQAKDNGRNCYIIRDVE